MIEQSKFSFWKLALFALPPVLLLLTTASAPPPVMPAPRPLREVALTAVSAALPPDPPRQNDPWTPPVTTLPPDFVAATKTLFRQGLADPRGGEYREITVRAEDFLPGHTPPTRVHGWVLPRAPGETGASAVCWNGQVYSVTTVGPPADLKTDVRSMTQSNPPGWNITPFENEAVSQKWFSPLKACLLLRLGEASLAEQVWAAHPSTPRGGDPYLSLASEWTSGLFRRTIDARLQGDDPLALFRARRLSRIRARIEGEAAERRLPRLNIQGYGPQPVSHSYLDFLDVLPEILADQERRVHAPKHTPALQAGEKAFSSKADYIAALIGDLDEVNPSGWVNSTPVMNEDPIVRALVDQGDEAVEPLIHAIATDLRLTRSVGIDVFQREVHPARVAQAAFAAVAIILQTSAFGDGPSRDKDPARTAAALQQYWDKYKNVPLAERWYGTLADDRATPQQWQEAADAIVRPTNVTYLGDGAITRRPQPGVVFPLRGASLRDRNAPSVSQLMARRVPQIGSYTLPGPAMEALQSHNACLMALDLARWDPQAAVPTLRTQTARLDLLGDVLRKRGLNLEPWGAQDREEMTMARVRGNDTHALEGYVAWLATLDPVAASIYSYRLFEPLWRFPHDPAVEAGAARLFNGPPSTWMPLVQQSRNVYGFGDILHSPLLGLKVFRRPYLTALHDSTPLGTLIVTDHGWQGGNVPGLGRGLQEDTGIDPLRPKTPRTLTIRRDDLYAWHLSRLGGMPRFQFYWPRSKRGAAIGQAASRLRRYGSRFEYRKSLDYLWEADSRPKYAPGLGYLWDAYDVPLAHLTFPRLDHPATPAEAVRGDAIFSLAGQGERRVWPLPHWPLPARWVTDRRYPQTSSFLNGRPTVEYQQDGLVWQAEEVWQKGQWRRFYGFVGPHDIARVPADQIEFPPDNPYQWMSFSPALDGKASLPDDSHRLPVGGPLPVTLILRCRSSREQQIPSEWLRTRADGPALREGLHLRLSYSPGPLLPEEGSPDGEAQRVWTPLTPARTETFAPTSAARRLTPTQKMQVLQLDLRDWYDLSRPGSYRLAFEFDGKRSGLGEGNTLSLWFELTS